jgi:asparagine synthase (glutamine-hydrolysing)
MCGIAGIVLESGAPASQDIEAMIGQIAYRGPDAVGVLLLAEQGVAFGHRRLSILDLSSSGGQPMASADGRFVLVFNGEIYNYVEIRRELEGLGYGFKSQGDTEVLLTAYAHWGQGCLRRLIGMFAFAIWDCQRRELFAARDRLGIKPFYYHEGGGALIFASEIKSILALRWVPKHVEPALIDTYLELGYVPGELTLHGGIRRLLPGHVLHWRCGRVETREYWDFSFANPLQTGLTSAADRVLDVLSDAVRLHLRSDVPLGVFLSGGLDSSAVVSLLSKGAAAGLKTFCVAYDVERSCDETPFARKVAAEFATDHHEIRVTPRQFADFIPRFVWHMDEPVADSAAISLYYVSRLARRDVVVCLSGEGSDELFAGYDFYRYNLAIGALQGVFGIRALNRLGRLAALTSRFEKARKYLDMAGRPFEERYRGTSTCNRSKKELLLTPELTRASLERRSGAREFIARLFARSRGWDPLSRMLYFDTKTWLVDQLLIKADRMSMASSIELRVPFLDHRVVECAASIPSRYKLQPGQNKVVLKKALRGRLPACVLRRRKMGFPTPLESMFRKELFEYAHDLLLSPRTTARGYFNTLEVRRLLTEHRAARAANQREIWQLVVLEEWHRQFGM